MGLSSSADARSPLKPELLEEIDPRASLAMSKRPAAALAAAPVQAWSVRRRLRGKQTAEDYDSLSPAPAGSLVSPRRRPATATVTQSTHLCHGREDQPCIFSIAAVNGRARYQGPHKLCPWCNPSLLEQASSTSEGRGRLNRGLRFFWAHDRATFATARARLPEAVRAHLPLQALGLPPAFHSAGALDAALASPAGRGSLLRSLRKRQAADPGLVEEALRCIPAERARELQAKLEQRPRRQRQAARRAEAETPADQWRRLLALRQRLRAPDDPGAEQTIYDRRAAADRARVRRKFFPERPRLVPHTGQRWANPLPEELAGTVEDVLDNDTGLPKAAITPQATFLEAWCKQGAWGICAQCGSLEPRHLKEVDSRRIAGPGLPHCRWCRRDGVSSVLKVADVPRQLRGLTPAILAALRPLDIDCGPYQRPLHGYRYHTALVRLLWAEETVESKIAKLSRKADRKQARKAHKFLMQSRDSEYKVFARKHAAFLGANPDPSEADRRRPLQQMEAPGIECALWPDLYWGADDCETVIRATDPRRLQRKGLLDEDDADEEELTRNSLRRSYLKKLLGPILDFAGDYEVLHFMFDLAWWTDLGAKRHICPQMPMRVLLKGASFTAAYWAVRHAAILDLQRQCGYPILFKTWAPYEWSAPYHKALLHHLAALLRSRQHLATLETLHLSHILVELLREWVVGGTRKHGESSSLWRQNLLDAQLPDGRRCRLNFAARLEFQDGKRKLASQDYHGRAAVHLHAIVFAEDLSALCLEERLFATEPAADHPLRGYVMDQLSHSGTGWPVEPRPSHWDPVDEVVRLQHRDSDHEKGVRAYGMEEVDVLKCHVDNLMPQAGGNKGRGLLMRCVATYNVKFSASFDNELLSDAQISGYGLAMRVLSTFHPGEPEMVLSLFPQVFPQFALGGTMQPIVAPWPTMLEQPAFVRLYENCFLSASKIILVFHVPTPIWLYGTVARRSSPLGRVGARCLAPRRHDLAGVLAQVERLWRHRALVAKSPRCCRHGLGPGGLRPRVPHLRREDRCRGDGVHLQRQILWTMDDATPALPVGGRSRARGHRRQGACALLAVCLRPAPGAHLLGR